MYIRNINERSFSLFILKRFTYVTQWRFPLPSYGHVELETFILQYERDRQIDKYSPFKNYKKVTKKGSQKFNDIENIFCQTLQIRGHIEECSFETLDFLVYILLAYLVKYVVNIIRTTQLILHNSERVQKCLECT